MTQVVLKNKINVWLFACGLLGFSDLLMEYAAETDAGYQSVPQLEVISATAVLSLLGTHTTSVKIKQYFPKTSSFCVLVEVI